MGHRRFGQEKLEYFSSSGVPFGTTQIVAAQSGFSVVPVSFEGCSTGAISNYRLTTNGKLFFAGQSAANGCTDHSWEGAGLELPVSSGVSVTIGGGTARVSFYYHLVDNRAPISKLSARNVTYNNVSATSTPNQFGGQYKT